MKRGEKKVTIISPCYTMKLRREELKKQGVAQTEVSEISEGDLVETFGIAKNQLIRAAEILTKDENTEKLGDPSF